MKTQDSSMKQLEYSKNIIKMYEGYTLIKFINASMFMKRKIWELEIKTNTIMETHIVLFFHGVSQVVVTNTEIDTWEDGRVGSNFL